MPRSRRGLLLAQVHAAGVLGATLDLPGTSLLARRADRPHEDVLAGAHATIVRPTGAPPWPALVFMNGATPDGRTHPTVLRLSAALARTGHLVFIPDLPGIAGGELSPVTLANAVAFTQEVVGFARRRRRPGRARRCLDRREPGAARCGRSHARDADLGSRRHRSLSDLAKVMLLATTGTYRDGAEVFPYPVPPYLAVGLARSLAAMLPPTAAATALCTTLRATDPSDAAPPNFAEGAFREAGADAMSLFRLLSNRDPARFDDLYAALPDADPVDRKGPVAARRRTKAGRACRDRNRAARSLLPGRRVAGTRRSLSLRSTYRDLAPLARNAASEPSLPGRARTAERLLRSLARRRPLAGRIEACRRQ